MTTKTYKSPSSISINVILDNNKNFRIQFKSKTIGGSVYRTSDQQIQEALEKHYDFKKLFFLDQVIVDPEDGLEETVSENEIEESTENVSENETNEITENKIEESMEDGLEETVSENKIEESTEKGFKIVTVSDLETAKEYLATTFGIKKTDMRSKKSVMDIAMSHNIEFTGL